MKNSFLIQVDISPEYLYKNILLFLGVTVLLLVTIFFHLYRRSRYAAKCVHLTKEYSSFISEIILCESEEELAEVLRQPETASLLQKWLPKRLGKFMLIKELVTVHKSLVGKAAENLRWLFVHLELHKESVKNLSTNYWHIKSAAIQVLAEMQCQEMLPEIYQATNHSNFHVRTEAQIAVVKMTGFEGLQFLNEAIHPITQWQQLCLLQHLSTQANLEVNDLPGWLASSNETVVEFALRLVEHYKIYSLHNEVADCLLHNSLNIRQQAIHTLKEIAQENTAAVLVKNYQVSAKEEQVMILEALKEVGTEEQLPFLTTLLEHQDDTIKYASVKVLQQVSGNWLELVQNRLAPQGTLTHIISQLSKEEVA